MNKAATNTALSGAAFKRLLLTIICALTLTACGHGGDARVSLAPPPPSFDPALMAFAGTASDTLVITADKPLNMADRADVPVKGVNLNAKNNCAIKHRFDRSAAIAYHFSNQKTRIALNMSFDGVSPERTMLRLTHKFQAIKNKRERCLYDSPVQGVVGSVINEFVIREEDTVWQELKAKNFKFWE